jgi:tetratricopeptide (TPR) repeat protein
MIYGGALVYAILKIKKKSVVVFGILFFLVSLSIYSNLVTLIGSSFGERFLFLPSVGFCIVLAWLLLLPSGKEQNPVRKKNTGKGNRPELLLSVVLLILLLVFYSVKTFARNSEWKSQWTLFSADVTRSPNSAHMRFYWGLTIRDKGKDLTDTAEYRSMMVQAIGEFKKALEIYPYYPECYEQLGLAYFRIRDLDESLKNYEQALKLNPFTAVTYGNMGIIYFQKRDLTKALELYQKAVSLDPNYDDGYFNLGSTYGMMRQYDKALENFKKCVDIKPDYAQAYYYIGLTYNNLNQPGEGKKYMEKAYQLDPSLKK